MRCRMHNRAASHGYIEKKDVDKPIDDTSGIVPRFIAAICERKEKLLAENKIMRMKVSFLEVNVF